MIRVQSLRKTFRTGKDIVDAVDGVHLVVEPKEFFVLLGLSGSGKTTLLRCVAGLERPQEGEIVLDGQIVSSAKEGIFVPPEERGLGMVFQSYAVWPHMTVFENVAFPLVSGNRRLSRSVVREKVLQALDMVQLTGLEDRPAPLLSGGQQQRVALARALAMEPKCLLMDEPLSNLDARLREEVRDEIRSLSKRLGMTVLYVTHDQIEAMAIADRIAVMSRGKILQVGPPRQVYQSPESRDVAIFLGRINEFRGRLSSKGCVESEIGPLICGTDREMKDTEVTVAIRPEDIRMSFEPSGLPNEFKARLLSKVFLGDNIVYRLVIKDRDIHSKSSNTDRDFECDGDVYVRFPDEKLRVLPK